MRQLSEAEETLAYQVIGAAIEVHRVLGAGFLEEVYHQALREEFLLREIPHNFKHPVAVTYKRRQVGAGELDFLVGGVLIVELKAVQNLTPIHEAQLMSYLKMTQLRLGLLINFNVPFLKQGIQRIIRSSQPL
ncbi:MAG: GxxExxY protein [Nostocaceae cyanobacterium]|nr:GxxExxY protein [Nostocaceae cyanobacterium]